MEKIHVIRLVATATLASLLMACGRPPVEDRSGPPVTVAHPRPTPVLKYIDLTGTVGAFQSVTNVARVAGYLESLEFEDGTFVTKGTPLFKIQEDQYVQDLKRDQAKLTFSAQEYRRQLEMLKKNATSERSVERSLSEMKQDEANVALAELNLEYTLVEAPFDGLLGQHLVDAGNMVGANAARPTEIIAIEQIDPIYVNFSINTRDALRLRQMMEEAGVPVKSGVGNAPVLVQLENETDYPHQGVLDFSNNSVDTSTGTIQLRGIFANPDRVLFPGLFAAVRIPLGPPQLGLVLPDSAVLSGQEGDYVFALGDGDVVERRSVVKGPLQGADRAIEEGVVPSDRIVVNGIPNIRPGEKVRVVNDLPSAKVTPVVAP